jgi:2-iminobutanoate/2-iminopropanoate deaminase
MKIVHAILCISVFSFFLGCSESKKENENSDATKKVETPNFYKSHEPKKQDLPFSDAVQIGNTFYLSGQIGMDHVTRELVPGGIEAETKQALGNIRDVLSVHGLQLSDVVKVTVILENIEDFSVFNTIYETYFPQKPARTTFAAKALAKGAKIEIEVIAIKSVSSHFIHR